MVRPGLIVIHVRPGQSEMCNIDSDSNINDYKYSICSNNNNIILNRTWRNSDIIIYNNVMQYFSITTEFFLIYY